MFSKVNKYLAFLFLIVSLFLAGCSSSDDNGDSVSKPQPMPPVNNFDLNTINQLIKNANNGETVLIEPGTYLIDGQINFKQGVSLKAEDFNNKPVFNAKTINTTQPNGSGLNVMEYTTQLSNVAIEGIVFHNIGITVEGTNLGTKNITIKNCVFDYGERKAGTDEKDHGGDKYLSFRSVENVLVENCDFLRRNGTMGSGRGVQTKYTNNAIVRNNRFGGDNPEVTGFFVCAINDRGTNSLIEGNTIRKSKNWNELDYLDHGIYALDFNGVTIRNNIISGWPRNGSGGSIKVRNAQNLLIEGNTMSTSGIIMYVNEQNEDSEVQLHLKNVIIKDNTINIEGPIDLENRDLHGGIGYYTNFSTENGNEESIRIESNTINNGYIQIVHSRVNTTRFNLNEGGIYNNIAVAFFLKNGINNSGNTGEVNLID